MMSNTVALPKQTSSLKKHPPTWISAGYGILAVLLFAYVFGVQGILRDGLRLTDWLHLQRKEDVCLLALLGIGLTMIVVEWCRLRSLAHQAYVNPRLIHPLLEKRQPILFILDCGKHFCAGALLFFLMIVVYKLAGVYDFHSEKNYYRAWFRCLDLLLYGYLIFGFPYVLATQYYRFDPKKEAASLTSIVLVGLNSIVSAIHAGLCSLTLVAKHVAPTVVTTKTVPTVGKKRPVRLSSAQLSTLRGFGVKAFFVPLMTVFFVEQFSLLCANVEYTLALIIGLLEGASYTLNAFNNDLFHFSLTLLFTIDVAIAWVGYVSTSRWLNNEVISVDPSLSGWVLCLCCYPPFQFAALYFAVPPDHVIFQFSNQGLVTGLIVVTLLSYVIYTWATVAFGVKFSNLTHRGIIASGPYRYVRHPAYAAKNFSWWCILFPIILYNAMHGALWVATAQTLGLVLRTAIYYGRAITEERHLMKDEAYKSYCLQVPWRFIPRVF